MKLILITNRKGKHFNAREFLENVLQYFIINEARSMLPLSPRHQVTTSAIKTFIAAFMLFKFFLNSTPQSLLNLFTHETAFCAVLNIRSAMVQTVLATVEATKRKLDYTLCRFFLRTKLEH